MDFFILAPRVGLEPTTYRLTAERSTNWAKEEYNKLATTYLPSKVTRKYFRHPKAWLLCSVWVQVFPFESSHQKFFVHFLQILNFLELVYNLQL